MRSRFHFNGRHYLTGGGVVDVLFRSGDGSGLGRVENALANLLQVNLEDVEPVAITAALGGGGLEGLVLEAEAEAASS